MLAITHLIVSLLLIQIFVLDRNDAFVALVFGVLIDLDHLIGLKDYAKANGIMAVFDFDNLLNPGGHWKSVLHNPMALAIVGPLSFASRLAIPLIFWGVHVGMDLFQDGLLGQFSQIEAMLLFFASTALVTARYSKYLESGHQGTLSEFLGSEAKAARSIFSAKASY